MIVAIMGGKNNRGHFQVAGKTPTILATRNQPPLHPASPSPLLLPLKKSLKTIEYLYEKMAFPDGDSVLFSF